MRVGVGGGGYGGGQWFAGWGGGGVGSVWVCGCGGAGGGVCRLEWGRGEGEGPLGSLLPEATPAG